MASVRITALAPGDGEAVASLWRDLWLLHESWNGYPAARDPGTYTDLAERLEAWARRRNTDPVLGQHIHLVARDPTGLPIGQVEGWLDRHGSSPGTPTTCEVRSLVVDERVREYGVGSALLGELETLARHVSRGPTFAVAEVLVPNSALSFYEKLGYRSFSFTTMLTLDGSEATLGPSRRARQASAGDAMSMARLEMERRTDARARGDLRLDRPTAVDASFAQAVARHLAATTGDLLLFDETELVAQASLSVSTLEAPFAPVVRAALGRLAVSHGGAARAAEVLALAAERARRLGARRLEISDLAPDPDDSLRRVVQDAGARPFSRIVGRLLP